MNNERDVNYINEMKTKKKTWMADMLQHAVSVMVNQKDINISKGLWWSPAAVASSTQIHSGHHLIKSGGAVTLVNTLSCVWTCCKHMMQIIINMHITLYFSSLKTCWTGLSWMSQGSTCFRKMTILFTLGGIITFNNNKEKEKICRPNWRQC